MKIGIIFYSISGHSMAAARKLEQTLTAAGHQATQIRLEIIGPAVPANETADLKTVPAVDGYDAIVMCTPVRGGALPPPVMRWIEKIPTFTGMKVACLITHFFPSKWGADQVMAQFKSAVEARGAVFCGWREARWFIIPPGRKLDTAVKDISVMLN